MLEAECEFGALPDHTPVSLGWHNNCATNEENRGKRERNEDKNRV